MNMVGVTIGVGREYQALAREAVASFRRHTGLDAITITGTPPGRRPHAYKLWLWDVLPPNVDAFVWIDADTFTVRDWSPAEELAEYDFAAVFDLPSPAIRRDSRRYRIEAARYFNSGLFLARRSTTPAFATARRLFIAERHHMSFVDQTALNVGVQRTPDLRVRYLPREFNTICSPRAELPERPIILHRAGGRLQGQNADLWRHQIRLHTEAKP